MAEYTTVTNITSGNIGNALHSVAIDHVVAIAKDIYDTEFVRAGGKGGYQSEINSGFSESLNELSANTNTLLNELSANTDAHFNVVESALTDFSANTNTHFGILDEHTDDLLDRCSGFTYMTNDEYAYAIVDPNGVMLFGIRYNGDVVYNTGMSDEVRGRLNELEGVQVMQNDQYIFAILDEQQNVLFGIKADGTVVEPKNEFDAKIEKVQKKANENYSFCVALSAVTIALQEQIDAMSASTSEAIDKLVDFDNTVSAVTEHISGLTETLSGVSDATVERLHDFDGWNLVEGDFMLGIADVNGYQLLKIDNSGKTFVGNGLVVYGEKAGLDVMDVNNYVYAVTDSEDKVLFGVTTNGASVINKSLTFNDLGGEFTIMEDTPDWAYVIQDANKNVVFGIGLDGNTYIPKGMPEDTKARFKELECIQVFDKSENWNMVFADPNGNIPFGITTDGTTFIAKGIPEDSKVKFNEIKRRFEQIEGIQVLENTDNFMYAIVDSENTVIFGIKPDGTTYIPKGIPQDVQEKLDEFQYSIMHDETYIYAITDKKGLVLFGIDNSGRTIVNDITGNIGTMEVVESDKFVYAIYDQAGNILFAILTDGSVWVSQFDVSVLSGMSLNSQYLQEFENEEFIHIVNDKEGKIVFGVTWDGTTYIPKGMPEDTKAEIKRIDKELTEIDNKVTDFMANFVGGAGDWSESSYLEVPIPHCAMLNLITDYPLHNLRKTDIGGTPGVDCEVPIEVEFWDMHGNYFKKPVLISAQGNSSMAFMKKNFAMDFFFDKTYDDEFTLKFGDWVSQDSYHFKAYYTDFFRGRCAISYALYEEMVKTRPFDDDRPYKYLFAKNNTMSSQGLESENHDLNENQETGAKCFPMGFPVILYQNGKFYGVYSWQIKKHRDNYYMNRKNTDNVHIDGTLGVDNIWLANGDSSKVTWTSFEIRNPNPKSKDWSLTDMSGNTYDGDFPKELIDETSPNWDGNNKSHKNTLKVKQNILKLSSYISELKSLEDGGASYEEMREEIANRFMVSFMVDYILETNLMSDGDGYAKNWQWTTWDGKLWTANPYDHDGIMGAFHIGVWMSAPGAYYLGNSLDLPSGWIFKYYMPELKARWAELRNKEIFDAKHISNIVKDWSDRIGYANWEREYEKWDESPCNRPSYINEAYWSGSKSYLTAWNNGATYSNGSVVSRAGTAWRSLISGNIGNTPSVSSDTWTNVYWDANRFYSPAYKADTIYEIGNKVVYNNRIWESLSSGRKGVDPSSDNTAYWIVDQIDLYDSGVTYDNTHVVVYDNKVYISNTNGNIGNIPSEDPENWTVDTAYTAYSSNITFNEGDKIVRNNIAYISQIGNNKGHSPYPWKSITIPLFNVNTTYAIDEEVAWGNRRYKSKIDNNTGNYPSIISEVWEEIPNALETVYSIYNVAYYGKSMYVGFTALSESQNEAPITKFYNETRADGITNHYPQELGSFDSIYRTYNWLVKRIEYLDINFGYKCVHIERNTPDYAFAIVDSNDIELLKVDYDGTVTYAKGMSNEVLSRFEELNGIQIGETGEYPFAVVGKNGYLLLGINDSGQTVTFENSTYPSANV